MFTGLIETTGVVVRDQYDNLANRLCISSSLETLQAGESIAVNGVCLTLLPSETFGLLDFDVSPETLKRTTLGELAEGDAVNLERALMASSRLGGHFVSGHVDTTVHVHSMQSVGEYIQLELSGFTKEDTPYLVSKGSITVEGVSLTINAITNQIVQMMLVPHTLKMTTLNELKLGQRVNIEFDYFTRIVAHQLQLFGKLDAEVQ